MSVCPDAGWTVYSSFEAITIAIVLDIGYPECGSIARLIGRTRNTTEIARDRDITRVLRKVARKSRRYSLARYVVALLKVRASIALLPLRRDILARFASFARIELPEIFLRAVARNIDEEYFNTGKRIRVQARLSHESFTFNREES